MDPVLMKFVIALIPLFVFYAIELYLLGTFAPKYFRNGILGFSSRIPVMERGDIDMLAIILSDKFKHGFLDTAIIFKTISPTEIAFRDKICNRPNSSFLMHGLIGYVPEEKAYVVTGRFNWTSLVFIIGITVFSLKILDRENRIYIFILIFLLLSLYVVDIFKYRRVAKSIPTTRTCLS